MSTAAAAQPKQTLVPQCVCASCRTPQHLPRPTALSSGTPFQCATCRLTQGGEVKIYNVKRAFPTEHSTRTVTFMFTPELQVFSSSEELCQAAAAFLVELTKASEVPAGSTKPRLTIALSGGSTPKRMYNILRERYPVVARDGFEYFFGDVRLVPDTSADSNFAMAYNSLLSIVEPSHVHPIPIPPVGAPPTAEEQLLIDAAAAQFEADLRLSVTKRGTGDDADVPALDIVLLGLGPDGHTASLFPGTAAAAETQRLVASCMPPGGVTPYVPRITITQRIIHAAKHVVVLATGADKAWVLRRVMSEYPSLPEGETDSHAEPPVARLLRGCTAERGSTVHMFLDQTIAAGISNSS